MEAEDVLTPDMTNTLVGDIKERSPRTNFFGVFWPQIIAPAVNL